MPPEVFEVPAQFSDAVDVFSFGCVTISTLTHQWPEPGPAKRREERKVIGLTEHQRREHYLALFTVQEKEVFLRLIEQCLQEDPSSRPSSSALVEELARTRQEMRKGSAGESVSNCDYAVLETGILGIVWVTCSFSLCWWQRSTFSSQQPLYIVSDSHCCPTSVTCTSHFDCCHWRLSTQCCSVLMLVVIDWLHL